LNAIAFFRLVNRYPQHNRERFIAYKEASLPIDRADIFGARFLGGSSACL
jgi:hypothetical protein